jgi:4-oxalocrotonate tautomerase
MMPIVEIKLVAGWDEAAIKRCVKAVARTIHETLGAPLETIRVIAIQVPAQQWAVGDQTRDEIDAARRSRA